MNEKAHEEGAAATDTPPADDTEAGFTPEVSPALEPAAVASIPEVEALRRDGNALAERVAALADALEDFATEVAEKFAAIERTASDVPAAEGDEQVEQSELEFLHARIDTLVTAIERAVGIDVRSTMPQRSGERGRGTVQVVGAEGLDSY